MSPAAPKPEATPRGVVVPAGHPDLDGLTREVGIKDEGRDGPLVILTAGLHGNEPGGVRALRALFAALEDTPTAGRIVGLAGNLAALQNGVRHHGQDLNRMWTEDSLRALGARRPEDDTADESELRALFSIIEAERDAARGRSREVILVDLHSTSADGGAFSVVPDSLPSRRLARDIGLPVVLGLEERIEGPLLTWLVAQGDTSAVVEGGQHEASSTRDVLLASLWVVLDHARVLPEGDVRLEQARRLLRQARGDAPEVLDLIYAHAIAEGEDFAMRGGWRNFMPVEDGCVLADQRGQEVSAPLSGYMLMPLYQGLGTEGFFLCRAVSRRWLLASRLLRRSWIEHGLRALPGVVALDTRAGRILARRGAPRWMAHLLHLFGFRKNAPTGDVTEWTRRPQ
ncbi:MAG: succinylglutamate desuccinylase/aspartoacylase family protein [Planctomycetota bacterium]|nr:succinylglutamate desuccinylase/aspartoacylase family protein [Planctomycetota bacterium]